MPRQKKSDPKPPATIWTPPKKLPERVRNIAFSMFMERWKVICLNKLPVQPAEIAASYRQCIEHAQAIVEAEGEPSG